MLKKLPFKAWLVNTDNGWIIEESKEKALSLKLLGEVLTEQSVTITPVLITEIKKKK
jgi:hypothetical protein